MKINCNHEWLKVVSFEYGIDIDIHKTEVGVVPHVRIDHIDQLVHLIIEAHGTRLL